MTYNLPRNNRACLYKYTSVKAAKYVIESQAFRWSAPTKFNDPFDHQTGFSFDYTGADLANALTQISESAIFGNEPFNPPYQTQYGNLLRMMRAIRDRLGRDEVMKELRDAGLEIAGNFPKHCQQLNDEITSFLTHSRVLCLTEAPDNVVMWSHYADEHRGVVFKLRRLEEEDHRLIIAQPVEYINTPLPFLSLRDYIENLVGLDNHDTNSQVWKIAYRKHEDWSYEREWRIHVPLLDEPAGDGYSYYPEPKELFEAIYLGCRMEQTDVDAFIQLAKTHLPNTQVFKAKKGKQLIELEFELLS